MFCSIASSIRNKTLIITGVIFAVFFLNEYSAWSERTTGDKITTLFRRFSRDFDDIGEVVLNGNVTTNQRDIRFVVDRLRSVLSNDVADQIGRGGKNAHESHVHDKTVDQLDGRLNTTYPLLKGELERVEFNESDQPTAWSASLFFLRNVTPKVSREEM